MNETGNKPQYAEDCASMLAVTPSGDGRTTGIVSVLITASLFLRLFLVLLSYSLVTAHLLCEYL